MDETIKMKFCPQAVTRMSANQKIKTWSRNVTKETKAPLRQHHSILQLNSKVM